LDRLEVVLRADRRRRRKRAVVAKSWPEYGDCGRRGRVGAGGRSRATSFLYVEDAAMSSRRGRVLDQLRPRLKEPGRQAPSTHPMIEGRLRVVISRPTTSFAAQSRAAAYSPTPQGCAIRGLMIGVNASTRNAPRFVT